jgi:hypothetical protein
MLSEYLHVVQALMITQYVAVLCCCQVCAQAAHLTMVQGLLKQDVAQGMWVLSENLTWATLCDQAVQPKASKLFFLWVVVVTTARYKL